MPPSWKCWRPVWMEFWEAWSSGRCSYPLRGVETRWSFKSLPTQPITWFCDLQHPPGSPLYLTSAKVFLPHACQWAVMMLQWWGNDFLKQNMFHQKKCNWLTKCFYSLGGKAGGFLAKGESNDTFKPSNFR